ncbi:MAG: deoxyribonuclease IV [Armatimonadota bacterium]
MMRIGAHVRLEGGLVTAVERAAASGCEAIQVFAGNPNAWKSAPIRDDVAMQFRQGIAEAGIQPVVIHTAYLLNLASPDEDNYTKSTYALSDSMHRAEIIGAQYVVTHIGSTKGEDLEASISRIWTAIRIALDSSDGNAMLLLENSTGSGNSIGSQLEQIALILDGLKDVDQRIGICLDTAHLWGAGYDLSSEEEIDMRLSEVDSLFGLERLKVIHLNDTLVELGSKRDRHENIGNGKIGIVGFNVIVNHPSLSDKIGIIETPHAAGSIHDDVELLKELRNS